MKVTVFTPTYNRGYILQNLYHSLQRQTSFNFEWLIIDDGSDDGTQEQVRKWKNEDNAFSVRYYNQDHGGKCRAINKALGLAEGELFLVIDSDDYLTDEAIEKIVKWESDLPEENKYCGVSGNLGTGKSETGNKLFDIGYFDGSLLDRYHGVNGERAYAFYTEIHREYLYPVFEDELFMTEAVAWNRMAHDGYKMRFYNDIICVYKYLEDGLTKAGNSLFLKNPHGYALWLKECLEFEGDSGLLKKIKLYYSLCVELCPLYDAKNVADCLQINPILVKMLYFAYKIKHMRD